VKVVHVNLFNDGILISTVRKATKVTKKKQTIIQPNKLVFEQFIDLQSAVVANVGNTEGFNSLFTFINYFLLSLFIYLFIFY